MIEAIKAEPKHLRQLFPQEPGAISVLPPEDKPLPEPSWTLTMDGRPVAVVGGIEYLPGILSLWGLISKEAKKRGVGVIHATRRILETEMRERKIRRAELTVTEHFTAGIRLASALGFTCEGLLKKYGADGSNHWRFARID